jgi:hypothetical protein
MAELAPETMVMLYDGTSKPAGKLTTKDILMGAESDPVRISFIGRRNGTVYSVKPNKGETLRVGKNHVLALRCAEYTMKVWSEKEQRWRVTYFEDGARKTKGFTVSPRLYANKDAAKKAAKKFMKGFKVEKDSIIEINVKDYLEKSATWRKNRYMHRTGVEYWDHKNDKRPIDPYILGHWLGDGTSAGSAMTSADPDIVQYYTEYFKPLGLSVKQSQNYGYRISTLSASGGKGRNPFLNFLNEYNLIDNKHIPDDYLYGDRESRFAVLAGLIDSDGSNSNNLGIEITQKNKALTEQVMQLAKSLGFWCTMSKAVKYCMYKGEKRKGTYWRLYIAGSFYAEIPLLLERKRPTRTSGAKSGKCSVKITSEDVVEPLTVIRVKGGDKRIMLGDFTITCAGASE